MVISANMLVEGKLQINTAIYDACCQGDGNGEISSLHIESFGIRKSVLGEHNIIQILDFWLQRVYFVFEVNLYV